jgi:hypothetical protein
MAYSDLIEKEGIDSQYLVILSPRRRATGFTLFSGSVYSTAFDYGYVTSVQVDGVALANGSSTSLSAGQFYFASNVLYIRKADSTVPTANYVVATYELYYGTKDEHWHRDPLNTSSDPLYYEAKVEKSPDLKSDISQSLFGFQPVQRSTISIINTDHALQRDVYDSSFSKASIKTYHVLREAPGTDIDVANIKLVYDGMMQDVSWDQNKIRIETVSGEDELSSEYRNTHASFYSSTLFPNIDPQAIGRPVRYVYGVVDGFLPVNVSYVDPQASTTSDNRQWAVIGEQNNLNNVVATVGGGTHTTTRTFLTALLGLRVGDHVFMNRASGGDEYKIVTAVGVNYIDHTALASPMTNGDTVERSFVGAVTIIQNDVIYRPLFNRDYTTNGSMAGGISGITFVNNFEANVSMPTPLTNNDKVILRVYGRKNDLTLGGPSFGVNDSETNNITRPVMVILDLIKKGLGIPEARLNTASFTQLLSDRTDALGFAIPAKSSSNMPKYRDILVDIIETSLIRMHIDDDLKWTVGAVDPMGVTDREIDDFEIVYDSISCKFSYKDVYSDFVVRYRALEASESLQDSGDTVSTVSASSTVAKLLHKISRQKLHDSLHFKEADAIELVTRLVYLFGDRFGELSLKAKNRFFLTQIGDVLEINRTKVPGFSFDPETERQRKFSVSTVTKNRTSVTISAYDQKGIEDNSGSW